MPSPEQIELTMSGLSAAVALHGAQLISLKTAEGQELLWQGYPSQIDFEGPFVEKPGIALLDPGDTRHWRLGITLQPDGTLHEALKDAV